MRRDSRPGVIDKIAVEQPVRRRILIVAEKVHERKGKVVEHVDRGDPLAEFDGVEQDGLLRNHDDVCQMQVAMAPPDESFRTTCSSIWRRPSSNLSELRVRSSISSEQKAAGRTQR